MTVVVGPLVNHTRTIVLSTRRTSVRLEEAYWEAIAQICQVENLSLAGLFDRLDLLKGDSGLTAFVRVFVITYFGSWVYDLSDNPDEEAALIFRPPLKETPTDADTLPGEESVRFRQTLERLTGS